jgi:hypothetical protein
LIDSFIKVYPFLSKKADRKFDFISQQDRMFKTLILDNELKDYCKSKGGIWPELLYGFINIWLRVNKKSIDIKMKELAEIIGETG